MALYKLGSSGEPVTRIQQRLQKLGLYRGPLDGAFGGGTEAAVKAFQAANGLDLDGVVGDQTWRKLFREPIVAPPIAAEPVESRCVAITGAFETNAGPPDCFAGISGDFDGQGLSFGVCQWNFGQDSLQPLLTTMLAKNDAVARGIFQDHYPVLAAALASPKDDLMAFARSIQHPVNHTVNEPWRGMLRALGRTSEFQKIQVAAAGRLLKTARAMCREYGLKSERALALMFDIVVQNGSIQPLVKARIQKDFDALPADLAEDDREVERMRVVAVRRAEAANPRWVEDVRARKLCLANGAGKVHGVDYDLEGQYGIGLGAFA
jgi:putative peptidoglycan binding protein